MDIRKIYVALFVGLSCISSVWGISARLNIIPYPNKVEVLGGYCDISKGIHTADQSMFAQQLYAYFQQDFAVQKSEKGVRITCILSADVINEEGYELYVDSDQIRITASTPKGHFYGLQTLRQLVNNKRVPRLHIVDEPRLGWRAFMLDEARHFQGKQVVKQMLDEMAALKMNTFHWHLTDDAGWRIEIKKYPRLTAIGATRDSTQVPDTDLQTPGETGDPAYDAFLRRYQSNKFDGRVHQGFYTQEDIREIVAYAQERCIQIIPEISMPGHASAAIAAYPWLGTTRTPIGVPTRFGVMLQVFDPSSPAVVQFLKDVLTEVSAIFPAPYIHIGGDEVKHDQWKASTEVTKYMEEHQLESYKDVQVRFTNEISAFVEKELGKSIVGWSEILGVGGHVWQKDEGKGSQKLSKNAVVQFWTGNKDILKFALDNNYKVVNSYCEDTYLDYSYEQLPLKRSYAFQVVPEGYEDSSVIGLGCQLWTEWVSDMDAITYQAFPRIAAYAELGWTTEDNKSYGRFVENLQPLLMKWEKKGYKLPKIEYN